MDLDLDIQPFTLPDEAAVVGLWQVCGLTRPWNDPRSDIARKLVRDLFVLSSRVKMQSTTP